LKEKSTKAERIDLAWRLATGKPASAGDKALALKFLQNAPETPEGYKEFALAVFNFNSFLYVN
ncbi:MAG: hypothetical protein SGI92_28640, partial [Bryobacteraceae bacterium]|nr:hypothetical protein [Bryobacteraceae bacterium]